MRTLALAALLLAACAAAPRGEAPDHEPAVYENVTVEQVRRAAVEALGDVSRFMEPARITDDGRVIAEYGASGRTTIEVRFAEIDGAVAAEVAIEEDVSCGGYIRRKPHRSQRTRPGAVAIRSETGQIIEYSGWVEAPEASSRGPSCSSEGGGRLGHRERWVLDRIGEILRSG